MTNITKLYELAGVEKSLYCTGCKVWDEFHNCYFEQEETCKKPKEYPPFTAEKQLELIKWVVDYDCLQIYHTKEWYMRTSIFTYAIRREQFDQALAGLILQLWDELTDTQKKKIKEILECI